MSSTFQVHLQTVITDRRICFLDMQFGGFCSSKLHIVESTNLM